MNPIHSTVVAGVLAALISSAAQAGTPAPAPVLTTAEEEGGLEIAATFGYDSHYIFRGELLQENVFWTEVSVDIPLTENLSLNLTPWFLQDIDTDYNEFDLTGALTLSVENWEFSAGYAGYYYPRRSWGGGEGIRDEQEATLSVSRSFGDFTATVLSAYSFTRDAFYFEAAAEYELKVTEKLSLTPGVVFGWDTDYYAPGTDANHVGLLLTASYELTPWLSISPYVAGNLPFGHLRDVEEDVYGGVSVSISF